MLKTGIYTAEIIPDGDLDGEKITFSIAKKTFSSDTVNVVANTMSYTGGEVVPKFTVTDKETGAVVPEARTALTFMRFSQKKLLGFYSCAGHGGISNGL